LSSKSSYFEGLGVVGGVVQPSVDIVVEVAGEVKGVPVVLVGVSELTVVFADAVGAVRAATAEPGFLAPSA
jgi:hypothetical protein